MPNPKLWGPYCWYLFHVVSYSFDSTKDKIYSKFYSSLGLILPCKKCKYHYQKHIKKIPPPTTSKNNLASWCVDVHNRTNKYKEKKEYLEKEAHNLYHVDNKLIINHKYITGFLKIIFEYNSRSKDFLKFLHILAKIFPCKVCQHKLSRYMDKRKYKIVVTKKNHRLLFKNYLKIINQHPNNSKINQLKFYVDK